MSPLEKQVIDILGKKEEIKWQLIKKDEATEEEVYIINRYESNKTDNSISLDMLTKELGIYE